MTRYHELRTAIIHLLVDLGVTPERPINIFKIGPPLVDKGFSQDEIVNLLYALEHEKVIELMTGNRLRVREKLKLSP